MTQTETTTGKTSTQSSQDTLVIVRHTDLESIDKKVWKPMYKRLCGMAKLKGHLHARGLPGLGWCHFDGKKFRKDTAYVVFRFGGWQDHNAFIDRVKTVDGVRVRVCGLYGWVEITGEIW